jgi:hypothetical protein
MAGDPQLAQAAAVHQEAEEVPEPAAQGLSLKRSPAGDGALDLAARSRCGRRPAGPAGERKEGRTGRVVGSARHGLLPLVG